MTIEERKTALVFGGARGIGAAAVERLAKEGYDVAFTYVSRPDSAQALVAETEKSGRRALYAASLSLTLWSSQSAVNLNLWCKPEVCDAIRDFTTGGF